MNSLIVPVFKNEASIPTLLEVLAEIGVVLKGNLEVVFVVDGSPDQSYALLSDALPNASFSSKLILLTRNFGSFAAIRVGLREATGSYFAVMSADLQEPAELIIEFFHSLRTEPVDVVIGKRIARESSLANRLTSKLFWLLYRKFVLLEIPEGGIDVFGCNRIFRDQLIRLEESRTSLIGQIFWLGFRRKQIKYRRRAREHGHSAWTLSKKTNYMMDSIFAFTDFPVKMLIYAGVLGIATSVLLGLITFAARITGWITVPGYATIVLVVLFFGALNMFGLGLVGSYAWRAYENSKARPDAIALKISEFKQDKRDHEPSAR